MHTNTFCKYRKKLLASPRVHLVLSEIDFIAGTAASQHQTQAIIEIPYHFNVSQDHSLEWS